ncbi:hypothetical protein [Acinetobacter modestus]|uniref:hypothetical protein n=1 Tax=Acinetobacter modestus TaxID=1776740 RepID=UPI001F4A25AA|nr:hypothetical protein [Acinetobacter modestus]MCH7331552.1 hypothetical protein [Acinetobacter modestus]
MNKTQKNIGKFSVVKIYTKDNIIYIYLSGAWLCDLTITSSCIYQKALVNMRVS